MTFICRYRCELLSEWSLSDRLPNALWYRYTDRHNVHILDEINLLLLIRESEGKISWLLPNGLATGNACMILINICMELSNCMLVKYTDFRDRE